MPGKKSVKDYARKIREAYPDLVVNAIVPVEGHGQNNDVLIVNENAPFPAAASGYGLELLARRYPAVESYRDRIDFYRSTFTLQEALFGVENGDADAFERGIARYR